VSSGRLGREKAPHLFTTSLQRVGQTGDGDEKRIQVARKLDKEDEEPVKKLRAIQSMTAEDVTRPIAVSAMGEQNEVLEKQSENMRNVLTAKAPRQQRACSV